MENQLIQDWQAAQLEAYRACRRAVIKLLMPCHMDRGSLDDNSVTIAVLAKIPQCVGGCWQGTKGEGPVQVEAENRAAASAKEGLSRKLKEAELRAEMLAEQVADLQMSMERQRATADARWASRQFPASYLEADSNWSISATPSMDCIYCTNTRVLVRHVGMEAAWV